MNDLFYTRKHSTEERKEKKALRETTEYILSRPYRTKIYDFRFLFFIANSSIFLYSKINYTK